MAEYRMQGNDLYDRNKNRLGYFRDGTVFDAVNRRLGYLRGTELFDATNRRLASIRERDVYSAINNRMGSIEDFRKRIEKAPEGPAAVALILLLGKPAGG